MKKQRITLSNGIFGMKYKEMFGPKLNLLKIPNR